ncbi:hypothetical protein ACIP61_12550 [Pseudomonas fulva]|uniref:hypothetical protein n=1 Tax=Pseudomonas TaxID=286 RepID=UPI00370CA930
MKPSSFALDRHVYELLQSGELDSFTCRGLRDAYAQSFGVAREHTSDLRRYIFRQILRLERIEWVVRDPEKRGRDQLYHLQNLPASITLRLIDEGYQSVAPRTAVPAIDTEKGVSTNEHTARRLQAMVKETRLDFLTSMGEAERYKQLLDDLPHLHSKLENDYVEARDRSSRLLGHLKAVEKTLKILGIE